MGGLSQGTQQPSVAADYQGVNCPTCEARKGSKCHWEGRKDRDGHFHAARIYLATLELVWLR